MSIFSVNNNENNTTLIIFDQHWLPHLDQIKIRKKTMGKYNNIQYIQKDTCHFEVSLWFKDAVGLLSVAYIIISLEIGWNIVWSMLFPWICIPGNQTLFLISLVLPHWISRHLWHDQNGTKVMIAYIYSFRIKRGNWNGKSLIYWMLYCLQIIMHP